MLNLAALNYVICIYLYVFCKYELHKREQFSDTIFDRNYVFM